MKTVCYIPIKLNNQRVPGKNTKLLNGKPLLQYLLGTLANVSQIDRKYVFCSNEAIIPYLPNGIDFLKRPVSLDTAETRFNQIFSAFMNMVDADIYVVCHVTSPFLSQESICECVEKVQSGEYDSAFTATRIQNFLWQDGQPLNFDASNVPRTQDIKPVFQETSGIFVLKKEVFTTYSRRIGIKYYMKEISEREAIDIDNPEDFEIAEAVASYRNLKDKNQ